ncbi:lipoprotein YedD [Trabulsiella odontotermitis]|uniref:Lipoprotein n=1 Tax=Trabulsiella odontotermitis TaxID=379893 RepID=A0A0L0GM13_9ENTR|nr:lipoprotein YedD [Trabulsiella odontotermitis]KNC89438.1 lipoprotein [Trabulsiella odontotermitis]KNC94802.1 lipoprotein [Trabulsiella odontotermitis]
MKKLVMASTLLMLAGCVQVDNYNAVVKAPAPAALAGFWQSKGPQSAMVSPEAIASLIITKEGDTLDCRQWQRVTAVRGKLMQRGEDYYNVVANKKLAAYSLDLDDGVLDYDRLELQRVDRPTQECVEAMAKNGLTE